jgi:hypothetical protein
MIARRKGLWAPALVVGLWLLAGGGSFAATVDPACKAWPGIDEKAVNAFLDHFCYLGWQHDAQVRNTGPFIHRDGDKVLNFGVHPAVRIYYSPDLWKWMKGGRKGKPGARSMLVKEQFNPPAQLYAGMSDAEIKKQVNEWTVMVYAPEAAADGWYWVDHSPPDPEPSGGGKKKAPSFESRVSNELQYPSTGLGLYCLNCHASAVSEQTFATVRNCQSCHMPQSYQGHPLSFQLANIENTNFPDTDFRLPAADIDLPTRPNFARHFLLGINMFGLEMFQQFWALLGIRTLDPMALDSAQPGLVTAVEASRDLARRQTARVELTGLAVRPDRLDIDVKVTNLAGHKFPSGVGFRRAFIDFEVRDAAGKTLWASGASDALGVILGADHKPLKTEFFGPSQQTWQPPYRKITSPDQVQIYEELIRDPKGLITTSFVALDTHIKDNRLLPRGWRRDGPDAEITQPCEWDAAKKECVFLDQPGYDDGGGYDKVQYEVPCAPGLEKAARVEATLYYQTIPPYYLKQRFTDADGWDTKRLYYIASRLETEHGAIKDWKIKIAWAAVDLPAGVCRK